MAKKIFVFFEIETRRYERKLKRSHVGFFGFDAIVGCVPLTLLPHAGGGGLIIMITYIIHTYEHVLNDLLGLRVSLKY